MKTIKIAINGFGRIGRQFLKAALENKSLDIAAINDLGDIKNLAYLLEFDSVYGRYDKKIAIENNELIINGKKIKYFKESNPEKLPWKELGIDVVVESTGFFTSYEKAKAHLDAGAKRVVLSAPAKDDGKTVTATPNVNIAAIKNSNITSNASCTTNAITPIAAIMSKNPGIKYSILNTIHGYTSTQNIVDGPHKDFRRGRTAGLNIIPTSTGAAIAAAKAIPEMRDKFDGVAIRVPIATGSILDFTFIAERKTSVKEINDILFWEAQKDEWKDILEVTDKPLVSSDIIKNKHGAIVDMALTRVVGETLVKIMVWYDNEWGYANMLLKHVLSLTPFL
ncbi:MAG: type I glyceraldehyde-3-phosphate dehydrogenase [Parcubacteria group bacterium GW2011_GWA2_38_13b]|nr:MAG: type I glyceraldehyde-3-phosphate dehydrogenase [Parcubacteria group bacterium GW2011_GWA2_38_13b]